MGPVTKFAALAAVLYRLDERRRAGLRDKVVLITGGSRGLGLLLAREFAAAGARLVICSRDDEELERARQELESRGAAVLAVACDITDRAQVARLVEATREAYGRLDVLVNNAGVILVSPIESLTLEEFRRTVEVNFWGAVNVTFAALPAFRRQRAGTIVNITSIGGVMAVPHLLPYTASKFGLVGFSFGLQAELERDGIRVVTVIPSVMRTGSHVNASFKGQRAREAAWFSLAATLPFVSVSASRAARRIVRATVRGERVVTIGAKARVARVVAALAPGLTSRLLSWANRLLPSAGTASPEEPAHSGWQDRPGYTHSPLTALGDRAAERNNELQPPAS